MDEENFFWSAPGNVPADVQPDGSITEAGTGEVVGSDAGNATWYDTNYPGQITPTSTTTVDTSTLTAEQLAVYNLGRGISTPVNPATLTPSQLEVYNLGQGNGSGVDTTTLTAEQLAVYNLGRGIVTPVDPAALSADELALFNLGKGIVPAVDPTTLSGEALAIYNLGQGISTPVNPATLSPKELELYNLGQGNGSGVDTTTLTAEQLAVYNLGRGIVTPVDPAALSADELALFNLGRANATQPTATTDPYGLNILNAQQTAALTKSFNPVFVNNLVDPNAPTGTTSVNNPTAVSTTKLTAYVDSNGTVFNPVTGEPYPVNQAGNQVIPSDVLVDPSINQADIFYNGGAINVSNTVARSIASPSAVNAANAGLASTIATVVNGVTNTTAAQSSAIQAQVGRQLAQQQAVNAAQKRSINNGDWRVRLSLAPGAQYLYNDPSGPGILQPLAVTGGVIFPYTPKIETAYKADYDSYALTHSNYKGYFYKGSYTDAVNMTATFTAQDTAEANYLLAVIHFFRSVTKMFYGQDAQRGAPPPLVYLTGLGQYQFSAHPCAVTSFNYSLPSDVDYIRTRSTNINGTNMLTRRDKQDLPTNPISGAVARLQNLFNGQGISYGAEVSRPAPPTLGQNQPTYVPTRMDISISLLPVQSRQQVSRVFSLQKYANGDLLKGGFW